MVPTHAETGQLRLSAVFALFNRMAPYWFRFAREFLRFFPPALVGEVVTWPKHDSCILGGLVGAFEFPAFGYKVAIRQSALLLRVGKCAMKRELLHAVVCCG